MTVEPQPADQTATLVDDLLRPEAYPHAVEEVGFLQTHISYLFFAGERVYKVKRPVDLGFLDYRDPESRRHFCEEEVRLNRRLAPLVYLGVVPIVRTPDGHLRVNGDGEPLDWAVEMVRLPERHMLSSRLDRGEIDNEQMGSMAQLLAGFHADCATGPGVDEYGGRDVIRKNVEENFEQLRPYVGAAGGNEPSATPAVLSLAQFDFLSARARRRLDELGELFERRVHEQRIREGHGDLHAGNICFTEGGPIAYDCIEFSRRFRCGDVAADLAFLAMDLDNRGYPGFSGYLVKRYASLAADIELPRLVDFYKGYRAIVRAKVAALTATGDASQSRREELRREAMRYVHLAAAYELPPAMILTCGLPGSGKSWFARRLAGSLRAAVLRSDVRRKAFAGIPPTARAGEEFGRGAYSAEMSKRTYDSLLSDAIDGLQAGHSVIVDAAFTSREQRSRFVDAAARLALPYYVVHVTATEELVRDRMAQRATDRREVSDADFEVYLRKRASFEPPVEVPPGHLVECASGEDAPEDRSAQVIDRMIALDPPHRDS